MHPFEPLLLQNDPGDFLRHLKELLPVLIFLAAAVLPAFKRAHDQQKEKRRREQEAESAQPAGERAAPPEKAQTLFERAEQRGEAWVDDSRRGEGGAAAAEATVGETGRGRTMQPRDLEERVRRYFEELTGQRSRATEEAEAREARRAAAERVEREQVPSAPPRPTLPHIEPSAGDPHPAALGMPLSRPLGEIGHVFGRKPGGTGRAPRRSSALGVLRRGRLVPLGVGSVPPHARRRQGIRDHLRGRDALRRAIVLREILGPPKAEDGI